MRMILNIIIKLTIGLALLLLSSSCGLILRPENEFKHLEGQVVRIKYGSSIYKSDPTLTSAREPYVIKGPNQFPGFESVYVPKGTKMYVDDMKFVRTMVTDHWYAAGRVYIDGELYKCAFGRHHSYLELID